MQCSVCLEQEGSPSPAALRTAAQAGAVSPGRTGQEPAPQALPAHPGTRGFTVNSALQQQCIENKSIK